MNKTVKKRSRSKSNQRARSQPDGHPPEDCYRPPVPDYSGVPEFEPESPDELAARRTRDAERFCRRNDLSLERCREATEAGNPAGMYDAMMFSLGRNQNDLKGRPREEYVEVPVWFLWALHGMWHAEMRTGKSRMSTWAKGLPSRVRDFLTVRTVENLLKVMESPFARTGKSKRVFNQADEILNESGDGWSAPAVQQRYQRWGKRERDNGPGASYVSFFLYPDPPRGDTKTR